MIILNTLLSILSVIFTFSSKRHIITNAQSVEFGWVCGIANNCQKAELTDANRGISFDLNTCQLLCSEHAGLWPRPTCVEITSKAKSDLKEIAVSNIFIHVVGFGASRTLATQAGERFKNNVKSRIPPSLLGLAGLSGTFLQVDIDIEDHTFVKLTLQTDESYTLIITNGLAGMKAVIKAKTFFGARHGLETLSQVLVYDAIIHRVVVPISVKITDAPKYPLRGVMLDTSRSYIQVETIKRTLEGMAASKLNTFHWHITDSHSFPYVVTARPELSQVGAYKEDKVYTSKNIKDIVEYARVRGIRVIAEFDAPAHVGEGWQNYANNLVVCYNKKPWYLFCNEPPCGQLNPTQPAVYDVLKDIYSQMCVDFDLDLFHMGGDEVNVACWESVPSITQWMDANGYVNTNANWTLEDGDPKYMKLWDYFQRNALAKFDEVCTPENKKLSIILWTSHLTNLTNLHYLDKDRYIIHIWTTGSDPTVANLLEKGFNVIISNYDAMYLDCGVSAFTRTGNNWCSPYKGWQTIYDNRPELIAGKRTNQVLGGITPLWTEQSDDATVDSRVWPRAAAYGERTWSDPAEDFKAAVNRFLAHRERLVLLGIRPERLQPEWCEQHEGHCPIDGVYNV